MAEGSMRSSLSTDGEMNSPNEDEVTARSVEGQGESSSQRKSSTKKKRSKYELLEEKWNNKLSDLDSKIDSKLDNLFTMFRAEFQKQQSSTVNGDKNSESEQQSHRHVGNQRNLSQSQIASPAQGYDSDDDNISLQPGQAERNDFVNESDIDDDKTDDEHLSEKTKKCLFDIFGEDAIAKKTEKKKGIALDESQKEVLKGHWRAEKPNLITAFAEESKEMFPMDEETEKYLQVPSVDDLIGRCLVKKHGNKASFSKTGKSLYTQPFKMLEKIAYRGQQAALVGISVNMYMQQSLASLIEVLTSDNLNVDKAIQQTRDIFAMSTKSLDQMGRTGAFHHILRRQMCLTDTSLYQLEDSRDISDLPLTGEGVFGDKLEVFLKSRKEKNKTLDDLIPDFSKGDRKRRSNSDDKAGPSAKRPNLTVHAQGNRDKPNNATGEGFRIPKKPNPNFHKKDNNRRAADGKQTRSETAPRKGTFPPRGGKAADRA